MRLGLGLKLGLGLGLGFGSGLGLPAAVAALPSRGASWVASLRTCRRGVRTWEGTGGSQEAGGVLRLARSPFARGASAGPRGASAAASLGRRPLCPAWRRPPWPRRTCRRRRHSASAARRRRARPLRATAEWRPARPSLLPSRPGSPGEPAPLRTSETPSAIASPRAPRSPATESRRDRSAGRWWAFAGRRQRPMSPGARRGERRRLGLPRATRRWLGRVGVGVGVRVGVRVRVRVRVRARVGVRVRVRADMPHLARVGVGVRVGVRLRARARPRARVGVRVRVRGRGSPPRLLLQGDAAPLLLSEGQGAGEGLGREGSLSVLDDTKPVGEPGKG